MQLSLRPSFVCVALMLSLTIACGNSTTGPSDNTALGTFSFKVDGGSTIKATSTSATLANGILSIGGGIVGTSIGLALAPTTTGTGTYTFSATSPSNAVLFIGNPAQGFQAGIGNGSGAIVITSLTSTTVAGTFSFTMTPVPGTGATGSKSITEGVFNLTLVKQ